MYITLQLSGIGIPFLSQSPNSGFNLISVNLYLFKLFSSCRSQANSCSNTMLQCLNKQDIRQS